MDNKKKKSKKYIEFLKTQPLITTFFSKKRIYGYNELTNSWHCCECGIDMGPGNPRQLCGRYCCDNNR